ncbi:MAG: BMP family ABC transporter substrate-binding protein [Brevefilum sp.]|nr:BMP family ABC transporter substrate-binding protein [Brevefilum sp.]MDT8381776.1 BMP family ABC transporter substrate-binding protein [Brevefilum sp.]MDW7754893.1 BMP family ABC transporter substrate-binding protein [Brevefilum sp.]
MKKFLLVLLIAIMALSFAGCATESETVDEPEAPEEGEKVYNVVSLVNGNLGDKSFFDSAESGLKELADAGRITYKTIEMGGTDQDQPKWLEILNEVSSSGEYDLVIVGTYQMPDYLKEAATAYPDQKYLIYDDNTYVGENDNVANITYKQNDMGYLIGVFAGSMTIQTEVEKINPESVVGFIGGIDSPVINDFLYGFLLGAQAANPDIKVDTRYVNSYVDTATAKEMGLSMINDNNADILWGVAGLSGNGAAEAALESGKAWFIGVDSDQELTLPTDQAAITLTSGLKNVGQSIVWFIDEWDAGRTYFGEEVRLGISEGGVGVVTDKNFAEIAPQAVQDAVLAAQEQIVSGEIVVPTAIGDTTNAVVTLRDSLQP